MDSEGFDTERSEYDFFQRKPEVGPNPRHHLREEYTETEREEVQCSEWGDRYSTTCSSDEGDNDLRSSARAESFVAGGGTPAAPAAAKVDEKRRGGGGDVSSGSYRSAAEAVGMRMMVRHKDLKEIVEAIRDYFEKAAVAGEQLSEMLEISKEQLDRSFRQLRSESPFSFPFFIFEFLDFGYSEIAGKF